MACSIKTNSSGVQQVLAPNGERSLLFDSIMALPFVKDENDALLYHTAMSKYANDSYFTDQNGEPIMVFINSEDNNMLRIPDRVVATESYTAARGSVLSNRNVEVGVVKKSDPLELPAMFNRREWFENTRNQAMNTEKQVVSTAATGTKFFVLPSKNDFVSIALTNISSNEVSLVGLQNRLINNEYISTERTSLKEAESLSEEAVVEEVTPVGRIEISEEVAKNKIAETVGSVANKNVNTRWADWFLGENLEAKNNIAIDILADKSLRDAMMSNLYHLWKKENNSDISFKDFLNSEITVYRGETRRNKEKGDNVERGFSTYELTEEGARKFGPVSSETIKVKDLYGAVDIVGGEIEVLRKTPISPEIANKAIASFNNRGFYSELYRQYSDKDASSIEGILLRMEEAKNYEGILSLMSDVLNTNPVNIDLFKKVIAVEEDEVQVEVSETKTQNKMSLKIDGVNLSQISVSKAVKREDTDVFTVKKIKLDMPVSPNAYIETFAAATQEMINRAGKNIALTVDVSKLNESARVALQNLTKQGVARQIDESTYEIFEVPPQTVSGKDINLTVNEMIKENKIEARCRI